MVADKFCIHGCIFKFTLDKQLNPASQTPYFMYGATQRSDENGERCCSRHSLSLLQLQHVTAMKGAATELRCASHFAASLAAARAANPNSGGGVHVHVPMMTIIGQLKLFRACFWALC